MQRVPSNFEDDLDLHEDEQDGARDDVQDAPATDDAPQGLVDQGAIEDEAAPAHETPVSLQHVAPSSNAKPDESAGGAKGPPEGRFDVRRIQEGIGQSLVQKGSGLLRIFPHPLVAVGAVMLVGGLAYEVIGTEQDDPRGAPAPAPRVVRRGFEAPDFRRADKGAITVRQAAATLARHRAEHGSGGKVETQCASATLGRQSNGSIQTQTQSASPRINAQMMQAAVLQARDEASRVTHTNAPKSPRPRRREATRAKRAATLESEVAAENDEISRPLPAYLVGFTGEAQEAAREPPSIDLPIGMRIRAVLDLGISSARHGTAVARTTSEVVDASGRKVPAGSVLTGRSSSSRDRVYLDFTAIRVGPETFRLRAVGTENEDLGLLAERVEAPMDERTSARLADGALGAMRGLAAAGGGVVGRVVSRATDGVINEAQREQRVDRTVTLKIAAGTSFTVVVTG